MPRYTLNEHNVFGHAPAVAESITALTFPDHTPTDVQYTLIRQAHEECIAVLWDEAVAKLATVSDDVRYYSIVDTNGIKYPVFITRADCPVLH